MNKLKTIIKESVDDYLNEKEGLIVYHGTDDSYLNIDDVKPDIRLKGLYTTTDKKVALDYTGPSKNGKIFTFKLNLSGNILYLDYEDIYQWMVDNEILNDDDLDDIDLRDSIETGRIFQYDISSGTHYANYLISTAKSMGYDVVVMPDYLGSYVDNFAYVVINMNVLTPISEEIGWKLKDDLKNIIKESVDDYLNGNMENNIKISDYNHKSFIDGKIFKINGGKLIIGKYSEKKPYGIVELYVDDNFRRQGVATKLINFAMNYFNEGFMAQVSNQKSLDLHYKLGFRSFDNRLNIESYKESQDRLIKNSSVGLASPTLLNNLEKYYN